VSISLNAPDEKTYNEVTVPQLKGSFEAMCQFAATCRAYGISTIFTVVDVIGPEQIQKSQEFADHLGIPLRVRKYEGKTE
jgi:wyosine [tRNA(Phe)-imidazoG37] synthetase (radical SAM superfamily)